MTVECVQRAQVVHITPTQVRERKQIRRGALYDRNQLDELSSHFVSQETIDFERVISVSPVNRGQNIEFDVVPLHQSHGTRHFVEGGPAAMRLRPRRFGEPQSSVA